MSTSPNKADRTQNIERNKNVDEADENQMQSSDKRPDGENTIPQGDNMDLKNQVYGTNSLTDRLYADSKKKKQI